MPLTIGFDASSTLAPRTGVGRAALETLRALVELEDPDLHLRVLVNSCHRRLGPEHGFLHAAPRVTLRRTYSPGPRRVRAWAEGRGPTAEELVGPGLDAWHAAATYCPPPGAALRVVTLHDVAFLHERGEDAAPLGGGLFARLLPKLLPGAAAIVVPSRFTRDAVLAAWPHLDAARVHVVPLGVDPGIFYIENERLVEVARQKCGLPAGVHLLAISGHEPRKRAGLLLDVYRALCEREPTTPPLVVAGWNGRPPRELRERPDMHRRVIVLPHIGDVELAGLYTGAVATLLTSSCEGFGLPLLEAQACGSPVVCGRHSALVEIANGAARTVDSDDPRAWADALREIIFDQHVHDSWKERGLENASRYPWSATASALRNVYRYVAGETR